MFALSSTNIFRLNFKFYFETNSKIMRILHKAQCCQSCLKILKKVKKMMLMLRIALTVGVSRRVSSVGLSA